VAEQVEKVNPDLVVRDRKGKIYSVRYEAVERDVAQRVPERAPHSPGTTSDHHPTKVHGRPAAEAD
jgi:hypothetical protein